ncbi:hypothetical protein BOX15_Mlig018100g2, partial [Macrostomum lignano]
VCTMPAVSASKAARLWACALLLAIVCAAGGPTQAAALILAAVCFAAGCLTSFCRAGRLVHQRRGPQFPTSLPASTCPAGRGLRTASQSNGSGPDEAAHDGSGRCITEDLRIDQQLDDLLDCSVREFVSAAWYDRLSDCPAVPAELRRLSRSVVVGACQRASRADWTGWLTRRAPDLFAGHVRLYRRSLQRRQADPAAGFFRLEREIDGRSRAVLCRSRRRLGEFLGRLAESLAGRLLLGAPAPGGHPCHRRLFAELAASTILRGIDWLASPDSVNQLIVRLSRPCDVDSLLQALSATADPDEVAALDSFAAAEVARLRARDCGGSDDDEVRAGMASLDFLRRRCHERAAQLRRRRLPFSAVMDNPAGLAAFHSYLDSAGFGRYLGFYLNIEGWRGGGSSSEAAVCILADHLEGPAAQELRQLNSSIIRRAQQLLHAASSATTPAASRSAPSGLAAVLEDLRADLLRLLAQSQFYGQFTNSEEYRQLLDSLADEAEAADSSGDVLAGSESGPMDDNGGSGDGDVSGSDTELLASVVRHETTRTDSETYTSYAIRVTRPPAAPGQPAIQWELLRRYSEFSDLQSGLATRWSRLGRLPFPAKTSVRGRLNPSLVEQRRRQLDAFLRAVIDACCAGVGADKPKAESALQLLRQFLQQPQEQQQQQQQLAAVGNALDSLIDGVKRSFMKRPSSTPTLGSNVNSSAVAASPTNSGSDSDIEDGDSSDDGSGAAGPSNLPLRLLLLLLDEVFDLRDRSRVLRKAVVSTLSRLLRALLGDRVNRRIVDWARLLTGPQSVADGLRQLREALFDQPAETPERQPVDAVRTRLLCRAVLLASVPGELRQLLGNEAVRQGVDRLFRMLQCEELNRRLLLVLLESALAVAFPECRLEPLLARLAARAEAEEAEATAEAAAAAS